MMAKNLDNERLNIRIEIKNTAPEPMEVDEIEGNKSEEEGEIRDISVDERQDFQKSMHMQKNIKVDLFNSIHLDQEKLQNRAIRFALKPEEINTFTDKDLKELYISLGINSDNYDQIRFDAIHLRSSDELTLKDLTDYFAKYAPSSIEMIDDESYNVVWENKLSAARALYLTSQVVKGMPVRVVTEHVIDSFILDDSESSKEPALLNENRQVELIDDIAEEYKKLLNSNSVDTSVINIPIPPGYWRLGKENIHAYSVLMRFSMITDKKPQTVEKINNFHKTKVSENTNRGIFSRNKDIIKSEPTNKDPWGILAKTWNEDYRFREQERYEEPEVEEDEIPTRVIPENPELRVRLTAKRRLAIKENGDTKQSSAEKEVSEESDQENIRKKTSKVPRMRMYADEEEEKIKRKKLLHSIKKQAEKIEKTEIPSTDLRNILGITNRKSKKHFEPVEELDLSANLKNRRNKLVFTVAQDTHRVIPEDRLERPRKIPDHRLERPQIKERRPRSPVRFHNRSPERIESSRRESRHHHGRHSRKIAVGGMYSERDETDNYYSHKPKSKVALVIKTQKKPTVASSIRPRTRHYDTSSSSEKDSSSESSDTEESSEESDSSSSDDSDTSRRRKYQSQVRKNPSNVRVKNEFGRR